MSNVGQNITRFKSFITSQDRNNLNNHKSGIIWLTWLPALGKSTIAYLTEVELFKLNVRTYVLDGDNVRHGLNSDLGFKRQDRRENVRHVVEVANILADAGLLVLCAFITPFEVDREFIRDKLRNANYTEVYV